MKEKSKKFFDGMGIGCLFDVAVVAVFALAMGEERLVGFFAYAIVLSLPAILLRWVLFRSGKLATWSGRLLGPCMLLAAWTLAMFCPVKVGEADKAELAKEPVVSNHWEQTPPPGVRYVPAETNAPSLEAALEELDGLIGLKPVKEEVERFAKFVRVAQQRKAAGLKVAPISYHMVFTGNPGTGKTTVARIMAKIYRALGVVKNGHLVECDRGGLVAGYTGQTAIKTASVIDFALDGVLFVDEAYALVNGPQDSFGDEAISTLLKRMEDDRDRLVVIVAGYTHEMKKFIDANSGLASRFNHYVEFPDYSAAELAAMFRMRAKKSQYILSPEVESGLDSYMENATKTRDRKFGNGRWVRNLFEKAVERQASRVAEMQNPTKDELMSIELCDIVPVK